MTDLSVLIVDNGGGADALVWVLRLHGHDARAAYNGDQALAIAEEWHPDAVVLDVTSGGMNGVETARRLRQSTPRPLLLIAMTGLGEPDDGEELRQSPFDYSFLKPVDANALLSVLGTHASGQLADR